MSAEKKETYWSRFVHTYDEWSDFVVGRSLRRAIAGRLQGERDLGEVIEFGCGTGYYTEAIAVNATRVVATDLSEEMLDAARGRLRGLANVMIEKADCEGTQYPAGRFDTVFMANVLHIVENPASALRESHRLLKDGGLLLIVLYTDYGMMWYEKVLLGMKYFMTFGPPPPYGLRNYAPEELSDLVVRAGFAVDELIPVGGKPQALYLRGRKKPDEAARA